MSLSAQFRAELLGMVEETVRRMLPSLRGQDTALGTLVYRDPTGLAGRAVFDGSEIAVAVKVSGALDTRDGDRVALIRTGGYWTAVAALTMGGMGEANRRGAPTGTATKDTVAYSDLTVIQSVPFAKLHTTTAVRVAATLSAYSTVATTHMRLGVVVTGNAYVDGSTQTSGDVDLTNFIFNTANQHVPGIGGAARIINLPPGDYSAQIRWRRPSGTGVLTVDTNDWFTFEVDEIRRQG